MPLQRDRDHVGQTVRRVETTPRARFDERTDLPAIGTPGTDFNVHLVPRTTIPAATRVPQTGSDDFFPGIGTAYLFKVGDTGAIVPWTDLDGTVIWKTVYNFSEDSYEPNAGLAPVLETQDGTSLELQDGSSLELQLETTTTDFLGPETAVLTGIMSRRGRLAIPRDTQSSSAAPSLQPIRLERAVVNQFVEIAPDQEGDIELYTDQQLDDNPQAAAASQITLAATASSANGFYTGWLIRIMDGPGTGATRWIHGYTGSTRVATIGAYGGQITYDWNAGDVPDANSTYKLLKPSIQRGIWSHAENGQILTPYEEISVQRIANSLKYDIVRGMNRDVQRAVVQETGGILDGTSGQIRLTDAQTVTTGLWDFATAGKHIRRLTDVYVRYEKTNPFMVASTPDQGRIYRIIGVDCSGLVDSPGDL